MVAPDYQEFANRAAVRYPWQYRDLRAWHAPNLPKSARRCAIATLPDQHESGTFRLGRAERRRRRPKLPESTAV